MTTAHRPTWKAAVGQASEGGWKAPSHQRSALDAPAHTQLKVRSHAQNAAKEDRDAMLQQSLRAIEAAAVQASQSKQAIVLRRPLDPHLEAQGQMRLLKQTAEIDVEEIKDKYDDSDIESDDDESNLDAPEEEDDDDDADLLDDEDEEDDEAALQAELAKIRAERQAQQEKQASQEAAEELALAQQAAVLGNPLLLPPQSKTQKKRRWNDDVVFSNQAASEPAPQKRFINDTVRNDFHKRFLNKFIR